MNLSTAIVILIIAVIGFFAFRRTRDVFFGKKDCCNTSPAGPKAKKFKDVTVSDTNVDNYPYVVEVTVGGMSCEHCVRAVENAINSIEGMWATVDLEKRTATVRGKGEIDQDAIDKVIDQAGYYVIRQPKQA
ncbi:heavy-metal-associated domain-containing protein [Slackia heliotrinireducens]|jgi:copper chaperone CopZ|uniref:heavy-metal-associated domain-containing protein n=1 Tax=Slackia heliotrinireducens TaxID=84110 RepID=UPI0033154CA4